MGLESATYLDDLVTTNPVAGDLVAQGDDHLRLLKTVLKATLPGLDAPRYLEQPRADVASASAPDIWAATTNYVNITGTTTITDFADADFSGQIKLVRFDDALTLTHGAAAINLPGGANITTAAGDHALFVAQGTTLFNCIFYMRKNGKAVVETTYTAADFSALTYGRQTVFIPSSAMSLPDSGGATVSRFAGLDALDFEEGDDAHFQFPLPKSWDAGVINFRARCVVPSGGGASETVVFSLSAASFADGDAINSPTYGTAEDSSATWAADNDLMVGGISDDLTIAGTPAKEDHILFKLERNTSGTLGAGVAVTLLGIEVFYNVDAADDS